MDTGQKKYYDNQDQISAPQIGEAFYGQDARFSGHQPSYTDNGDGTVTDNITGLMWQKSPDRDNDGDIDVEDKLSFEDAVDRAESLDLAGYTDWRLPSIKELYSLILFSGLDPSGWNGTDTDLLTPFIHTEYFDFAYGDTEAGERIIDAQFASSTLYTGTTMNGDETMFGVNFADGRIKGYGIDPLTGQTEEKNRENYLGYSDWRLPNVKELQSIVDYTRSPSTTNSAAIDPLFNCSGITDEGVNEDYPFYWTSTTHANMMNGSNAAYVAFGEALGWIEMPPNSGNYQLLDVHGAGVQRSDPKQGDPNDYPYGHGPQGDVIRIYNYIRLVRDVNTTSIQNNHSNPAGTPVHFILYQNYPNPFNPLTTISFYLPFAENISLTIFDIEGREITTLLNERMEPGPHSLQWQAGDLPSGIYFYALEGTSFSLTRPMILLK